jgi:hypothetical protein
MSGFTSDGWYDLTATKVARWHSGRGRCEHGCREFDDVFRRHLEPAGFIRRPHRNASVMTVTGPGVLEGSSTPLYEALSGRASRYGSDSPAPWDPGHAGS